MLSMKKMKSTLFAYLWKKFRAEHPDVKSPLDVAVELEKMLTKDLLKSIKIKDIKDLRDEIRKHYAEKKSEKKPEKKPEKKSAKKPKKEESETSESASD